MQEKIGKALIEGTQEVFQTMLMSSVEHQGHIPSKVEKIDSHLTSVLGLGGDIKAMVGVHCTDEAAKSITSLMLGMEVAELDEDVKDAVGEVSNMIAGHLKILFAELDKDVQLSIPTAIIGNNYKIAGFSGAECVHVPFQVSGQDFWVEFTYIT